MKALNAAEVLTVSGGETIPLDTIGDKSSSDYQIGKSLGKAVRDFLTIISIGKIAK